LWWSNNDQRKIQKENIKNLIKRTKMSEKNKDAHNSGADSPPGLTHSLPTSATYSDSAGRTRAVSEDSQYSDFANPLVHEPFDMYGHPQIASQYNYSHDPSITYYGYQTYPPTPYEVDIKTERQMYVNDVPTRRDSTISSFSTYHPPPHGGLAPVLEDDWIPDDIYDVPQDMFSGEEEPLDFNFFDFSQPPPTSSAVIQVDEPDRHLLEHFVSNVLRLIFPVLEVNQHGSARSSVILPALETNKTYLHSCLCVAAIHLKSITQGPSEQLDGDVVRHRYATVAALCEALQRDEDHAQILEATLSMIFLQCAVGRPDDSLPDIPWHQHFQAATSLVRKLDLPTAMMAADGSNPHIHPPFNMTLASWIDILGATMLGIAPKFADTYREKHLSSSSSGLAELMGCEDRVMYLISEIACLEALKRDGILSEEQLCSHITLLGQQMEVHEAGVAYESAINQNNGALRPRVLGRNLTACFRKAARVYLLSLVPGSDRHGGPMRNLIAEFASLLDLIPAGPEGFDPSIVWPMLIAGAQSTRDSMFRVKFAERVAAMGEQADLGSFGRMVRLLEEVWATNDLVDAERESQGEAFTEGTSQQSVHWRDVMRANRWDFLLI
jgi:C6 transcription factor Pro1